MVVMLLNRSLSLSSIKVDISKLASDTSPDFITRAALSLKLFSGQNHFRLFPYSQSSEPGQEECV